MPSTYSYFKIFFMLVAGIDIGYTNAKIAQIAPDGQPLLIPDLSFREATTPSTIFLNKNGAMVGRQAEGLLEQDPEKILLKGFATTIGTEKNLVNIAAKQQWSPTAIYALLLKKLRFDIEAKTGQLLQGVVIAVPPTFTELHQKAINYAAAMAGIPLKGLLLSPLAIATHAPIDKTIDSKLLVVEAGGQYLRISIVQTGEQGLHLLAHKELTTFNEAFFNQPLIKAIQQQFAEKNNPLPTNPYIQLQTRKRAEALKKELVNSASNYLIKTIAIGNYVEEIILDKALYYQAIRGGCQQMIEACLQLVRDTQLPTTAIHTCLLAGGTSQIPLLQTLLLEAFPIEKAKIWAGQPIESTAFGAARYCTQIDQSNDLFNLPSEFHGKTSKNIGIRIGDTSTAKTMIDTLIYKNTSVPNQVVKIYYANPTNKQVDIEIGWYPNEQKEAFTLLETLSIPINATNTDKYEIEVSSQYTSIGYLQVLITDLQSTFFIKKDYALFEEQTLLMLQQQELVGRTVVNNLG